MRFAGFFSRPARESRREAPRNYDIQSNHRKIRLEFGQSTLREVLKALINIKKASISEQFWLPIDALFVVFQLCVRHRTVPSTVRRGLVVQHDHLAVFAVEFQGESHTVIKKE